jgi:CheY-like chemotaxis protein
MTDTQRTSGLVLVATADDWIGRSVATVLEAEGYTVARTGSGRQGLDLARRLNPDAILVEDSLSDVSGSEVCRALRDDPLFDHATPLFLTAHAPVAHAVRTRAYQSGAWEYCSQPIDAEALLLKLRTFTRARRELHQARAELVIDPITGLYSEIGLNHWAAHLGALASRRHEPFACVAVMPESLDDRAADGDEPSPEVLNYLADVCRTHSRRSDVIGYLGKWQFVILAPGTDSLGVMGFVARLREVLGKSLTPPAAGRFTSSLHAGYCAVHDFAATALEPTELLRRAETALRHARASAERDGVFSFDELPVS